MAYNPTEVVSPEIRTGILDPRRRGPEGLGEFELHRGAPVSGTMPNREVLPNVRDMQNKVCARDEGIQRRRHDGGTCPRMLLNESDAGEVRHWQSELVSLDYARQVPRRSPTSRSRRSVGETDTILEMRSQRDSALRSNDDWMSAGPALASAISCNATEPSCWTPRYFGRHRTSSSVINRSPSACIS